jgi:hypothetical protein
VHEVKRILRTVAVAGLVSTVLWAQAHESTQDHFAPNEDVSAAFAWERGAQCSFADRIGVVLRSNWQNRHWIKLAGKQVEFNGQTKMSDAGWYQEFVGSGFTVTLRLQRVLPERRGSDSVRLTGGVVVTRPERTIQYQVTGNCGA